MKQKVLVLTDFSECSQNALDYVGQMFDASRYQFLLVHVYTVPLTYTVEGIAVASVGEAFQSIEEKLGDELQRVQQQFPQLDIAGRYMIGGFMESVQDQIATEQPWLVIFGTTGLYTELWHWDSELLHALRSLSAPVLLIPKHIRFQRVKQIGFAADYKSHYLPRQVTFIRNLVERTGGRLHVVHVLRLQAEDLAARQKNESRLREEFQAIEPLYADIENPDVIGAISQYIRDQQLDLLIVIPRKHEFWYNLFHKSNIRQLAFLNYLPILTLPE